MNSDGGRAAGSILARVIAAATVLLCSVASTSAPTVSPPEPGAYRVSSYDLEAEVDRDRKMITGRERIHLRSGQDGLAAVIFPQNGLRVLSVSSETGAPWPHVERNGQIEVRLPAALARGQQISIAVSYEATAPRGVEFQPDAVYTSFDTCHWMICRDRPDDKATLTLSLIVPDGLTVVASGVPTERRRLKGARTRHVWKEEVPSSPYLFGFAVGRFSRTVRKHRGVTFEYYAAEADMDPNRLKRLFADDDRMLDFFVERAGRPLPRSFYRQVVVDGSAAQEMSSFSVLGRQGLDARLTDPQDDWLVAHELAHQFWGNLVTCADWSHFWLNEGLTVFMVAAYKERRWGRPAYQRELQLARERHQIATDAAFDVPLAFAGEYPSLRVKRAITYSKAMLFLDRLRETMGERAFWAALRDYTRRFAGHAVRSQDFQRMFAAETDKDLSRLFDDWVYADRRERN